MKDICICIQRSELYNCTVPKKNSFKSKGRLYAALPTTAGRTLLWSRSAGAGNSLASIVVVEAARSLAMAADCPITQFIRFRPCSLEAAGLEIKAECPRRNSYRRRSRCCRGFGVHHFVGSVVVGAAQEDR